MARMDKNNDNPNDVTVYVKKHKVVIKGGTVVCIYHENCKKPCSVTTDIVGYVTAEAFVTASSVVLAEIYSEKDE